MELDQDAWHSSTRIIVEVMATLLPWSNENQPGCLTFFDQESGRILGHSVALAKLKSTRMSNLFRPGIWSNFWSFCSPGRIKIDQDV